MDGQPIRVDTRKAVAVLAYLSVAGTQTRDHLAALLWPESDEARAKSALRRTLSVLNKGLGDRWLVLANREVALDPVDRWVDVERFRDLRAPAPGHDHVPSEPCDACLARLEEATALHRGELLEGFAVRDASPFEDWRYAEAERLRRELAATLDRLVNVRVRTGDFEGALLDSNRRLGLDEFHEPTHRRMMLLHAWAGRRAEAIRQFRRCVSVLHRELGVGPVEQTAALYEAILAGRTPEPPAAVTSSPPTGPRPAGSRVQPATVAGRSPFVGREAALEQMMEGLERARDGHLVVVEGELGVGRTRLATEFIDRARERGATVFAVRCHEDESELAFTVVAEILRAAATEAAGEHLDHLSAAWRRELSRIVPDVLAEGAAPPNDERTSSERRRRLLEAFRHALAPEAPPSVPTVVLIDDAQWMDEASLDALAYVSNRLGGVPLCLVLLWRTEAVSRDHRLRRLASERRADERLTHVRLERLTRGDVAELAARSGLELDEEVLDTLQVETEGLPILAVEYVRALRSGRSGREGGWVTELGMRDLLLSRLAPLSDVARQVLTAAAAIGRSFDLETVRLVSGRDDEELVVALEELVDSALVSETGAGSSPRFDFRHDKVRAAAYEETSLARRRLLHGRIADAFARPGHRGEPVTDAAVAQHLRLAGREDEAAEMFVAAAEHARSLSAHAEAVSHYRTALALGHEAPAKIHAAIGDLLTFEGDYKAAITSYESAAALTKDPAELAHLEYQLALVHGRRGDWRAAETHLEVALATVPEEGHRVLGARLAAERAAVSHRLGRTGTAEEQADEALELARVSEDTATIAQAHNVRGVIARSAGDLETAARELSQSLALAERLGSRRYRIAALNNLALVEADSGQHARALELAKTALALCRSLGDRHREAALLNNLADLLHAAGQEQEALQHLKQAVAIFAEVGEPEALEPEIWKLVDW